MEYVKAVLFVHVIAGVLSLLSGLLVFILRKGTSAHIRIGKVYYLAMTIVFITSIYVSLMKSNVFLFLIGIFSYYLVYTGILYNRNRSTDKAGSFDLVRVLFFALIFAAMILYGLYSIVIGAYGLGIILLVFGGIGGLLAKTDISVYLMKKTVDKPNFWIRSHLGRMTGSYIAAVTAFAVNNVHFLPPIVIWLLPTALGFFVIYYYDRKYSR